MITDLEVVGAWVTFTSIIAFALGPVLKRNRKAQFEWHED